jgi:hypothetical protein
MVSNNTLLLGFVLGLVLFVASFPFAYHHVATLTAAGIVKRLRKTNRPVRLRLPWFGGSWNPARPERVQYELLGPGRAVYVLGPDDEVAVHYRPRWGQPRDLRGPIPSWVDHTRSRSLPLAAKRLLVAYCLFLVAGALVGGLLARGSAADRAGGAGAGFLFAMLVASLGLTLFTGIRSFTHHKRHDLPPVAAAVAEANGTGDVWQRVEKNERIARRYLSEHEHPHEG